MARLRVKVPERRCRGFPPLQLLQPSSRTAEFAGDVYAVADLSSRAFDGATDRNQTGHSNIDKDPLGGRGVAADECDAEIRTGSRDSIVEAIDPVKLQVGSRCE